MRKTKVICTIGPASENEETLTQMCMAGMNVARLNFSHGSYEEHQNKIDLIKHVREKLNIPLAEVYGVVSFYTQFSIYPKGQYQINVCMGTACYVKGANEVLDKFRTRLSIDVGECTEDGKFSLEACRCIGACGLAPVVTINDEVYGKLTADDVDGILDDYEAR